METKSLCIRTSFRIEWVYSVWSNDFKRLEL